MADTSEGPRWWEASDGRWYPPTAAPGAPPPPPPMFASPVVTYTCPQCGLPQAMDRIACERCGQVRQLPVGVTLTSAGRRFGQYLLEGLLVIVTLVIGWIIWALIVWGRGQTPAMQVLHMTVLKLDTGRVATWGTMFLREFVGKFLIGGLIAAIFFPAWIVLAFMLLWTKHRQELWDKIAGTIVVDNFPDTTQAQHIS
jgi:uncharacterized RDD family membrane protein YckC